MHPSEIQDLKWGSVVQYSNTDVVAIVHQIGTEQAVAFEGISREFKADMVMRDRFRVGGLIQDDILPFPYFISEIRDVGNALFVLTLTRTFVITAENCDQWNIK